MSKELKRQSIDIHTDVLVIGTGGAGLKAALEARQVGVEVLVVSKMGTEGRSSTVCTNGAFTYASEDHEEELFRQVVETGGFLNNQRLVDVFVRNTPRRVRELTEFGVKMEVLGETDDVNGLGLIQLRGKGRARGFGMTRSLRAKAEALGARFIDNLMVSSLLTNGKEVVGAAGVHLVDRKFVSISARAIIVATGGGACLYQRADNPPGTTGDGIALAYNAGADLIDMECVSFQFPMARFDELFGSGENPAESLLSVGSAHYFLGGIEIDEHCRTTVDGLYAAGEVTGGLFGAARLGGTAMADVVVFGTIAGKEAATWARTRPLPKLDPAGVEEERKRLYAMLSGKGVLAQDVVSKMRVLMWRNCGIQKTRQSLSRTVDELSNLRSQNPNIRVDSIARLRDSIECQNMLTVANLIAKASLLREETRGCFWRLDFQRSDNVNWLRNIHLRQVNGEVCHDVRPVVMTRMTHPVQPRIGSGCFEYLPRKHQ